MTLQELARSKARVLKRAHTLTFKKLSLLPKGEFLAKKYQTLVGDPNTVRYGVLLTLMFEDWLDLGSKEKRKMFEQLHVQILCLYALILELDDFQDSNHRKQLGSSLEVTTVENIQKLLEENYNDEKSRYRTEWQNILISDTLSLFKVQENKFGFITEHWIKCFNDAVKEASATFVLETIECQKRGRLEEKLLVASNKNQMILASATLLAPMVHTGFDFTLYETAKKMMLPIQIIDDLYDWQSDYKEQKYTTLLREVPNWTMTPNELYVYLVKGEYFQELLLKGICLMTEIIESLQDEKIGKVVGDLFISMRADMQEKRQQIEKFSSFMKTQEQDLVN